TTSAPIARRSMASCLEHEGTRKAWSLSGHPSYSSRSITASSSTISRLLVRLLVPAILRSALSIFSRTDLEAESSLSPSSFGFLTETFLRVALWGGWGVGGGGLGGRTTIAAVTASAASASVSRPHRVARVRLSLSHAPICRRHDRRPPLIDCTSRRTSSSQA